MNHAPVAASRQSAALFTRSQTAAQIRSREGQDQGAPQSLYLLVRKSDESRAREALPGLLLEIRTADPEK